jgi:hypothetical protein
MANQIKKKFKRLNIEDDIEQAKIFNLNNEILLNNEIEPDFKLKEWKTIWCRRGEIHLIHPIFNLNKNVDQKSFFNFLNRENKIVIDFLNRIINSKKHYNNPKLYNVNKIEVLYEALNLGIKVPKTIVTRQKTSILRSGLIAPLICKPISEIAEIKFNSKKHNKLVFKLNKIDNVENLPDEFEFSMFQELIIKKYDLRIFFIDNTFISCAIINTALDSRNIMYRVVNFNLPLEIKNKLLKLSRKLGLNSGSIDMLYTLKGEFYFLEVNPVGQFEFYNNRLDLGISKIIAKKL